MWGLALAHVTVTQSGSSCCQGMEGWKVGKRKDRHLRVNSKEKTERNVLDRNKGISVNHPSPALCLHLDITLQRTGEAKKDISL